MRHPSALWGEACAAGGSVRAAAGLGRPPLPRSAESVHAAVVTLVWSTVQNVLDVLHYQVDGHCKKWRRQLDRD